MLHPTYKIQAGRNSLDPNSADDVESLRVSLDMDIPSDYFRGSFRSRQQGTVFNKGDKITVSLGYTESSSLSDVFNGNVDTLDSKFNKVNISATSSLIKLCALRLSKFYEQMTAGDIVKDLANTAGVSVEKISGGIKLPYYSVDDNRNAYEHIKELANISGFDIYANNVDKLMFTNYQAKSPHILEYGKNIIKILKVEQQEIFQSVRVVGESPSTAKGSDKAHWLTKQKIERTAGGSSRSNAIASEFVFQNKAIKDESTASNVAKAILDRIKLSVLIDIQALGDPQLMLGDTIKIQGMPDERLEGQYYIRGIEHFMSKFAGFVTILRCRGVS